MQVLSRREHDADQILWCQQVALQHTLHQLGDPLQKMLTFIDLELGRSANCP